MSKKYHGACLCGAVKFVATGAPVGVAACHCLSCRKHTGAPVAVYVDYARHQVQFSGSSLKQYASSPGVARGFCAECGTTISYGADNLPEMIHLHIGSFDDANDFVPTENENTASKLPWLHVSVTT